MQDADSDNMLKGVKYVATELCTVSIVFYIIGLMDYDACPNITGNAACNSYKQFMIANLIAYYLLICIPKRQCGPCIIISTSVITAIFTICHAALVGMAMNPDSKCPNEISAGCDAQAFKGYNILHYYSLIYLGSLAVFVGILICTLIFDCIMTTVNYKLVIDVLLGDPIPYITARFNSTKINNGETRQNVAEVIITRKENRR